MRCELFFHSLKQILNHTFPVFPFHPGVTLGQLTLYAYKKMASNSITNLKNYLRRSWSQNIFRANDSIKWPPFNSRIIYGKLALHWWGWRVFKDGKFIFEEVTPQKSINQDTNRIISFEWKSFCKLNIIMKTNNTLLKMKI